MTKSENTLDNLMAEAERLGMEQEKIEKRNRGRRAKGRPPLPDLQEREDMKVGLRRYRTGDATTVDGADALKLLEVRKSEMQQANDDIDEDALDQLVARASARPSEKNAPSEPAEDEKTKAAVRAAASARQVQDLKNGRIDHAGNWSEEGQKLEGGDTPALVSPADIHNIWIGSDETAAESDKKEDIREKTKESPNPDVSFRNDLYARLATSFEAIERSLSDLQGRVSEILTVNAPKAETDASDENGSDAFKALLDKKTQVVFDVGGTKMTFDAICVFSAPPCITVVSKIGSAKITPKPGAQLLLSYEMDGNAYTDDPVTFLGTRFDLPMFGLSFVGFIRDAEASMIDVEAGIPPEST